jgi:hypothetical protein
MSTNGKPQGRCEDYIIDHIPFQPATFIPIQVIQIKDTAIIAVDTLKSDAISVFLHPLGQMRSFCNNILIQNSV